MSATKVSTHLQLASLLSANSVARLVGSKTFTRGPTLVSVVRAQSGADALLGQLHPRLEQVGIVGSCETQLSELINYF